MTKARNIADLGSNDVLDTSSSGIDVTGSVTADGLTVGDASTSNVIGSVVSANNTSAGLDFLGDLSGTKGVRIKYEGNGNLFSVSENNSGTLTERLRISDDGDISFYEDTGTTAKFFWDASAESLGIGTSSPNLHGWTTAVTLNTSSNGGYEIGQSGTKYGAFALQGDGRVQLTNFTANPLTFQTNNAERMRIDSSGNLLVGKTASSFSTVGVEATQTGKIRATMASDNPISLNRTTSDGDIAVFAKDGATVGSIGTASTNLYIATTTSGIRFNSNGSIPCNNTGATTDNTYDLGQSSVRWKDLYLSGGVYLGGTGSANYLDDYEIGSWTTSFGNLSNVTGTAALNYAQYVKIGDLVHLQGQVTGLSISSTGIETGVVLAVPFVMNGNIFKNVGSTWENRCRSNGFVVDNASGNNTQIFIGFPPELVTSTGSTDIAFTFTYRAA